MGDAVRNAEHCEHSWAWVSPSGTSNSARICQLCHAPDANWLNEIADIIPPEKENKRLFDEELTDPGNVIRGAYALKENKVLFRRSAVEFEAVQFTGSNYDELRKFTGVRVSASTGEDIHIFNPIGTYLPEHLYDKEKNPPKAEMWANVAKQWRPVYFGEWIVSDNDEFISVTDEWMWINCVVLDTEPPGFIPPAFKVPLVIYTNEQRNEIGVAYLEITPGEVHAFGKFSGVTPIYDVRGAYSLKEEFKEDKGYI